MNRKKRKKIYDRAQNFKESLYKLVISMGFSQGNFIVVVLYGYLSGISFVAYSDF